MAYNSVYHFFLTLLEFAHDRKGQLGKNVQFEGREYLEKALAEGKGVYVLCMHLGSWEAMGSAVSTELCPSHTIVKKVGSDGMNRFVSERRKKNRFFVIERQKKGDAFKGIQDVFARGEIVGFVLDQAKPNSPKLNFFDKPAKTNTSFAAIWRKCPAPIIMSYAERIRVGEHRIHFLPELTLACTEDLAADVLTQSTYLNTMLEKCIRANPHQYFWMHKRWKT